MNDIEKGKKLFLAMVVILMGVSLLSTVVGFIKLGSSELIPGVSRTVFEGLLLYYIFKGKKWARIVFIVLLTIGTLAIFAAFMVSFNIMLGILLAAYVVSIYIVVISPTVRAYLKSVNS